MTAVRMYEVQIQLYKSYAVWRLGIKNFRLKKTTENQKLMYFFQNKKKKLQNNSSLKQLFLKVFLATKTQKPGNSEAEELTTKIAVKNSPHSVFSKFCIIPPRPTRHMTRSLQ